MTRRAAGLQFRVLYRQFLFRIVDLELLSSHAEGDSRVLLAQLASLLIFTSVLLAVGAGIWAATVRNDRVPPLLQLTSAWTAEHVLIAATMLVVGVFAVLGWESMFPGRRDVEVLGPLPVPGRTIFLAKVAAVGSALGLVLAALHCVAAIAWPLALARYDSAPAPALIFDPPLPPVTAADFPGVMRRDIAPMLARLDLAAADGQAGIALGVVEHGNPRVMTYGVAKSGSLFEIGSVTKTFTALLLAQMAVEGKLDLYEPVRDLLPPGAVPKPPNFEITLLDLATHHSGLPRMPDNAGLDGRRETYTNYRLPDLYEFIHRYGVARPENPGFLYSNVGFALLGEALSHRSGEPYAALLRREILDPLGLRDTTVVLSPTQADRLLKGHDARRLPARSWDLQAFAAAGGLRSTAGDMLAYLQAQLHPAQTPLRAALDLSHRFREYVVGDQRIALAWTYDPSRGVFEHGGATGGFTTFAFFNPQRDFAAVGMLNAAPAGFPFAEVLSEHVRQRLAGEPALSLAPVILPPAGPFRCFLAYVITMLAAGVFTFCSVLVLQGIAVEILPHRYFLRSSIFLQIAVFCILVCGFFLQQAPVAVLISGPRHTAAFWIPSYWFLGLYQQLTDSLHPGLAVLPRRAWAGIFAIVALTATLYSAAYFRGLRRMLEEPGLVPAFRKSLLPRFGTSFDTAVVQFSVRSLLRSRQHRMLLAFFLGIGAAFSIVFLKSSEAVAGPHAPSPWEPLSVPLLASTMLVTICWVLGVRIAFSLPLDLQ